MVGVDWGFEMPVTGTPEMWRAVPFYWMIVNPVVVADPAFRKWPERPLQLLLFAASGVVAFVGEMGQHRRRNKGDENRRTPESCPVEELESVADVASEYPVQMTLYWEMIAQVGEYPEHSLHRC